MTKKSEISVKGKEDIRTLIKFVGIYCKGNNDSVKASLHALQPQILRWFQLSFPSLVPNWRSNV